MDDAQPLFMKSSWLAFFATKSEGWAWFLGECKNQNDQTNGMGAPFLEVTKKNGDIWFVTDFRELNKCIMQPHFETTRPF